MVVVVVDAAVRFQRLDCSFITDLSKEKPARFGFTCPRGRGSCDGLLIVGADLGGGYIARRKGGEKPAMWDWDGDVAAPTFSPSINCRSRTDDGRPAAGCDWHGFIKKGQIV